MNTGKTKNIQMKNTDEDDKKKSQLRTTDENKIDYDWTSEIIQMKIRQTKKILIKTIQMKTRQMITGTQNLYRWKLDRRKKYGLNIYK